MTNAFFSATYEPPSASSLSVTVVLALCCGILVGVLSSHLPRLMEVRHAALFSVDRQQVITIPSRLLIPCVGKSTKHTVIDAMELHCHTCTPTTPELRSAGVQLIR